MAINDQFDDNAADLRNLPQDTQTNTPQIPIKDGSEHNVSKIEVILAVSIMLGVVAIVYVLLQQPRNSSEPPLVHQPLPPNPNTSSR